MKYYTSTDWNALHALDIRIAQVYEQRFTIPDEITSCYRQIERRLDGGMWRWQIDDMTSGLLAINAECYDVLPDNFRVDPALLTPLTETEMAVQDPAWYVAPVYPHIP